MQRKRLDKILILIAILLMVAAPRVFASRAIKSSALTHGSDHTGPYRALIIAVNDYKDPAIPDLETPLNDAKKLDDILRNRYGFKTELLLGSRATKKVIYNALRSLAGSAGSDESVLIYYAGHGELDRQYDDGWWIPYDAKAGDSVTYLDNTVVQKAMRSTRARHVLLISDSCYSGSLFGSTRAVPPVINDKYYRNMYSEKSRWGMTSGNKEPVSDSGTGGHSVFAYQLIKALKKNENPCLSTQELYTHIAPIIGNNSEQTPLCRPVRRTGDQGGQFLFLLASSGAYIDAPVSDGSGSYKNETSSNRVMDSLISVTSNIRGSAVYIDGKYHGKSDVSDIKLDPGKHTVRVEKEGYETYSKSVTVRKGRKISLQAILDKIPGPKGALYVDTVPDGANVRILNIGSAFYQGIELAKGRYHVEVSAGGYKTFKMWTRLDAGEDRNLTVRLEKLPGAVAGQKLINSIGMEFVYIEPGTFMMGSSSDETKFRNNEKQHRVTLTEGFYMQTTEVTQGRWEAVMGTRPWQGKVFVKKNPNHPAFCVSWNDCQEFIRRLNRKEGIDKYRLPTEAEWEYAARGATATAYSFGDSAGSLGEYAWYEENTYRVGEKYAHPVKLKKSNPFGLYDMHGNVWEWCEDRADYNKGVVTDTYHDGVVDPICKKGSLRVLRGGSWGLSEFVCRSANRGSRAPGYRSRYIGFRLVRTP